MGQKANIEENMGDKSVFAFASSWRPLFIPKGIFSYINDHTIFSDKENKIRILGTGCKGNYAIYKERSFIEGVASDIHSQAVEERELFRDKPFRGIKIAPSVYHFQKKGEYHLFFGPRNIYHFISEDGIDWEDAGIAVKSYMPLLRDPHVIKVGSSFLLYVVDFGNKISVYSSSDLFKWKYERTAIKLGKKVPRSANSAIESPSIVRISDNKYVLSITNVSSPFGRRKNYLNTCIFLSDDPLDFGIYSGDLTNTSLLIARTQAHAAEIFQVEDQYYMTSCGWLSYPKPKGVDGEGVWIRKIDFDI